MLLTKNIIKFNNLFVKIPRQTKRVLDLAENRWGYKSPKKRYLNFIAFYGGIISHHFLLFFLHKK